MGFEPTRGDPIGLAGRRLNRSAKVSLHLGDKQGVEVIDMNWAVFADMGKEKKCFLVDGTVAIHNDIMILNTESV